MYELAWWGRYKFIVWSHEDSEICCDCVEVQNGRLWASLFSNYLVRAHPLKNRLGKTTQKGEMYVLFETIGMGSRTEGAYTPEMMNWMHADLQIEVEKRLIVDDRKTPVWHAQGSIFLVQKKIILPVPSGDPSTDPIVEVIWKAVSWVANYFIGAAVEFHDTDHRFRADRGMGTAYLEDKLI